ncbi:spore maturation protein [Phosphitispora sp. TUW77]|uniref:spore maturation protein n=1 Tax=Phosphitispora sp. TUW77 TaxID=3152361 RepID=UPI003AB61668
MFMNIITLAAKWAIPVLLFVITVFALFRKVNVYESFIEGAQEGFATAVKTIPFLVAMFVAISVFRSSGAMALFVKLVSPVTELLSIPAEVLPLGIMRPLSGGGALGITAELIKTYGPDSFIGKLASTLQGSTDTTFFVLTLYFGSVGIIRYRYAVFSGLSADITGFIASVIVCNIVFR